MTKIEGHYSCLLFVCPEETRNELRLSDDFLADEEATGTVISPKPLHHSLFQVNISFPDGDG